MGHLVQRARRMSSGLGDGQRGQEMVRLYICLLQMCVLSLMPSFSHHWCVFVGNYEIHKLDLQREVVYIFLWLSLCFITQCSQHACERSVTLCWSRFITDLH